MVIKKVLSLVFLILFIVSCKEESKNTEQQKMNKNKANILIIHDQNHPDEVFHALEKLVPTQFWKKYMDTNSLISAKKPYGICFNLGVRATNGILALYLNNDKVAKSIADSMRIASEKLHLQIDQIEILIKNLLKSFTEKDSKLKIEKVSGQINIIRNEIKHSFKEMKSEDYTLFFEFGIWLEAVRQISGILKDNYQKKSSGLFYQGLEAQYFLNRFMSLSRKNKNKKIKKIIDFLTGFYEKIKSASYLFTPKDFKNLNQTTSEIKNDWVRG